MTKNQRTWLTMFIFSLGVAIICATMGSALYSLPNIVIAMLFGLLFIHTNDKDEFDES